jgi:NAD+ kinase
LKISRIGIISKEGDLLAKNAAKHTANLLVKNGLAVLSYPSLHMPKVDHVAGVRDLRGAKIDMIITFSGDGTILRVFRSLDSTVPCLCVNVGGRGILAELRPDEVEEAIKRILSGHFEIERRLRILPAIGSQALPPALNEVMLVRRSFAKTPSFLISLSHQAKFSQRMDGLIVTTPTGSTGHSFSYGSPFVEGTMSSFILTPLAPIYRFPTIVMDPTRLKVTSNFALELVIDGQETHRVEKDEEVAFRKHGKDAVFVRLQKAGSYRQLANMISLESTTFEGGRKV